MFPDHFGHQQYALSHRQVGKAYHAGMPGPPDEQKLAEVVVERDEDSALGCRPLQKLGVAGIVFEFSRVEDVVSVVPQPFCQSAAGATVDQELHRVATDTAASVSPAITACAYAMQARTSSFSSCG